MNEKVLRVVEYDKIIDRLTQLAGSEPGRKLCRELLPMRRLSEIEHAQIETEAALSMLLRKGSISFGGNRDFSYMFGSLAIGASLSAPELLHLSSFLDNVDRVKAYGTSADGGRGIPGGEGKSDQEIVEENPLFDMFDCLYPLRALQREICRCIVSEEEIADDASPGLRKVRREIGLAGDKIHQQLQKMVNVSLTPYLQDNVITMRGDRYCLPIKAEHKGQVPGIVHDQSSSGSTLFIEPQAIVSLNNTLRELMIQEKKEEEKVLAALSAEAAEHLMELKDNAVNMTALDFIFARGKLALEQNATRPIFNDRHYIHIRKGRHPLIDPKKVVPIDLSMGDTYDLIVITGPNTGGKTVTLKTVGLFELMGMAGLHIPAADRSELSVFRQVYADIGDEQSIEQSLSTFSSHMKTIVDIFRKVDRDCLCLFDELGAGTDPTEGAALAISILNFLHVRHITSLATTHYSELKVYAMRTEGVINASCEFDVETLQPTYRLLIGVPGKSNAFAISQKLGLPNYIIETAKEQLSEETKDFEKLLSELEENRSLAQKEKEEAERLREKIREREARLKDKEAQLDARRQEVLQKAQEEARDILSEAKKTADAAISDIRRSGGRADMAQMERTRSQLRDRVSEKNEKLRAKPAEQVRHKTLKASDLHVGDRVRVLSMGLTGTVLALPDKKGKVTVQCGIMTSYAALEDLVLMKEDAVSYDGQAVSRGSGRSAGRGADRGDSSRTSLKQSFKKGGEARDLDLTGNTVAQELNLLGMTTVDAIQAVDKYLDEARMAHLHSVRIVHGKGTGALRTAVHNYLRSQRSIRSFRLGAFGEGDAGVTIVEL